MHIAPTRDTPNRGPVILRSNIQGMPKMLLVCIHRNFSSFCSGVPAAGKNNSYYMSRFSLHTHPGSWFVPLPASWGSEFKPSPSLLLTESCFFSKFFMFGTHPLVFFKHGGLWFGERERGNHGGIYPALIMHDAILS
jgi:hypothetical protein